MATCRVIVGLGAVVCALRGQSAAPRFEVASIRVHEQAPHYIGIKTSGPRFTADAEMIRGLVGWAYNLKNYQLKGPPSSSPIGDTMFDIVAKAEGDGTRTIEEFRQILQALLVDRFKLVIHREMREMQVYALVVGKNGPKLKESAMDADPMGHLGVIGRNYQITRPKASMDDVVDAVANSFLDRPVVDRTRLTGTYELKLTFTPDIPSNRRGEPEPSDISIFTAVQEQLGLKLEPQKAQIEVVVIDHVEPPTEN